MNCPTLLSTVLLLTAAPTTLTAEVTGLANGAGEVSRVLWRITAR